MSDELDRPRHLANLADAMEARTAMRDRWRREDEERQVQRAAELESSDAGLRHFAEVTGLHGAVADALALEAAALEPPAPQAEPEPPQEHEAAAQQEPSAPEHDAAA